MESLAIPTLVQKKITDVTVIAIVKATDWFDYHRILHYPVLPTDFIVCRWNDFHDGYKSNIEARETIAICRRESDAKLIFSSFKQLKISNKKHKKIGKV